jgi:asparagine synthase (glutamine-hydrolysing)
MCGIAGSVNFSFDPQVVNHVMGHRGPDERNTYTEANIILHHLRLSILDIGGGRQPMHYLDRYVVIFNGEIYNHQDIRKKYNLQCNTNSDTETILHAYHAQGPSFLNDTDGMFALAIYDTTKEELFIARDRAGKKPLYYFKQGQQFVFASELNALRALLPLEMEEKNMHHYLRLGTFYRHLTPYKNVTELVAGSYLLLNCKDMNLQQHRWWDIAKFYQQSAADDFDSALTKTNQLLHQAVRRRLESSDLEVGAFLSGGIDSGLVTAIASEYTSKLKTFTVSFSGAYNEAPLAKLVADRYKTDHTEIEVSFSNLQNDLETILSNYGEPFFDSSAIPSYYVSREAKKHLTVILNGDGADELFAGYRRYVPFAKYDFFKPNALVKGMASLAKKILPPSHDKKSKYNYIYRLISFASKSNIPSYLAAGVDIFEDYEQYIIDPGFNYLEPMEQDFERIIHQDISGLKKLMHLDFEVNLFSDLLVKMDIATMAHSLEGRSPFLSREILEYTPTTSDGFKIKGGRTKHLLRELARQYLPAELIDQPKRGFEIPLKNWVEQVLRDIVFDYVDAPNALNRQYIQPDFTRRLLDKKIAISDEKRAKILWTLLCMEIWYKKNISR